MENGMEQADIFRKESLDYAKSPEQLDAYMKASGPGVWIVLLALVILMVTAIIWGVTGTLPETLEVKGCTGENGRIRCYIPSNTSCLDLDGCPVSGILPDGTRVAGYVESVSSQPYSKEELKETLRSDWIAENLLSDIYSYEIVVHTKEQFREEMLASVVITVDEVKPIAFLVN